MKIFIITGPPYSGKGTQCELLVNKFGFNHISTGQLVRDEKRKGTPLSDEMKKYEEKGLLVPDSLILILLKKAIELNNFSSDIILDGYPRKKVQVDTLINLLDTLNVPVNDVINITVPKEELIKRAIFRAETSTRIDDQDKSIHFKRIEVFENDTLPAINYMKEKFPFKDINGIGSIDSVFKEIISKIDIN